MQYSPEPLSPSRRLPVRYKVGPWTIGLTRHAVVRCRERAVDHEEVVRTLFEGSKKLRVIKGKSGDAHTLVVVTVFLLPGIDMDRLSELPL